MAKGIGEMKRNLGIDAEDESENGRGVGKTVVGQGRRGQHYWWRGL